LWVLKAALHETVRVNVIVSQTTGCLTRNKAGMEMKEWSLNPLLTQNYLRPVKSPAHQNVSRDITVSVITCRYITL